MNLCAADWRPISTAPKDKTEVLLHRAGHRAIANGYFLPEAHAGNGAWIWPYAHQEPTHWMPLPPALAAQAPPSVAPSEPAAQQAIDALEAAKNGLEWYRDAQPLLTNGSDDEMDAQIDAAVLALRATTPDAPVDMVLHCPACHKQHIDAPECVFDHFDVPMERNTEEAQAQIAEMKEWERTHTWTNPPHRSHLCEHCGHIWRPADVPTNGVAAVKSKGKADSPVAPSPVVPSNLQEAWAWRAFNPDEGGWTDWRFQGYKPPRQTDQWFQVVALRAAIPDAEPDKRLAHALQHAKVAVQFIVDGAKARPDLMCGYWDDACTHAEIAVKDLEAIVATPTQPRQAEPAPDAPVDTIKHLPLFMRGYDAGMKDAKAGYERHYDAPRQAPSDALTDEEILALGSKNRMAWALQTTLQRLNFVEAVRAILFTQGDRE